MLRPLIRPIVRPLVRGVTEPGYGSLAAQIRLLFASGEQGAWYDPSDLSTLFQNFSGTTPVTALGQPVGLMLDKRFGLVRGPELVVNGGFDSTTLTGWAETRSGAISVVSGVLRVTNQIAAGDRAGYPFQTVAGRSYLVSFRAVGVSTPHWAQVRDGSVLVAGAGVFPFGTYSGTVTGVFTAVSSTTHIELYHETAVSGQYSEWDNISVRELPGYHAIQLTDTARPKLQAGNKIDFDGVDDKLTTTFPDLGTAVTIVRSVPGTGASILTGQTIGAGARDDSTDHHGLLIINRALTAPETALVTRWANMRAGV